MTITSVFFDGKLLGAKKDEANDLLLNCMLLCNDTTKSKGRFVGDPTEIALSDFGAICGKDKVKLEKDCKRINEIPFDSRRKLMSTRFQQNEVF